MKVSEFRLLRPRRQELRLHARRFLSSKKSVVDTRYSLIQAILIPSRTLSTVLWTCRETLLPLGPTRGNTVPRMQSARSGGSTLSTESIYRELGVRGRSDAKEECRR